MKLRVMWLYESTHLARKSLPTTTLVIKDLVCGMADILWREVQLRQAFLELNVSDQTMTFIQLWSWKYSLQKALIQQISYIALASNTGFESRMCRGHCAYHAGVASFPGLACSSLAVQNLHRSWVNFVQQVPNTQRSGNEANAGIHAKLAWQ